MLKTDTTVITETERHATVVAAEGACCGGPAPEGRDGCCAQDAAVKATGGDGCGCRSARRISAAPARARLACCS